MSTAQARATLTELRAKDQENQSHPVDKRLRQLLLSDILGPRRRRSALWLLDEQRRRFAAVAVDALGWGVQLVACVFEHPNNRSSPTQTKGEENMQLVCPICCPARLPERTSERQFFKARVDC